MTKFADTAASIEARHAGGARGEGLEGLARQYSGVAAVLALIALFEILRAVGVTPPNPPAFLMIAIIYAAYSGGLRPGIVGAVLGWLYTAWRLALPGLAFDAGSLSAILSWAVAMPSSAVLAGALHQRALMTGARHESRRNAAAMHRHQEDRRLVVEHAMDAVVILDHEGRIIDWNPAAESIFGRPEADVAGKVFADIVLSNNARDDFVARFKDMRRRADSSARAERAETIALRRDGQPFPVEMSVFTLHANGAFSCGVIIRDLTERWTAQRRHETLMRELDHRVKNNLAAMLSIVDQTASRSEDIDDFMINFRGRVMAMARLHSSLAASRWSGADLHNLVRQTVEPYTHNTEGRVVVRGAPVVIPAVAVSSVSMALHELATNASRYGALSVPDGRVLIEWNTHPGPDAVDRLHFLWSEEGGPPVDAPTRYGFGRMLIEEGVRYEARGQTNLTFSPSGVTCELVIPMTAAVPSVAS